MAKQYLDYHGLETLTTAIKSKYLKKTDTTAVLNVNDTDIGLTTDSALNLEGQGISFSLDQETNTLTMTSENGVSYSIKENILPPGSEYSLQYQLYKDNVAVEDSIINIPKDKYLENVDIIDVTNANRDELINFPIENSNGQYIEFSVGDDRLYLNISDLLSNLIAGDGININDNIISVKVVEQNGLSLDSNGISLNTATNFNAGAMSSADKTKLDTLEEMNALTSIEISSIIDEVFPVSEP